MRSSDLDGSAQYRDWLDDRPERFRGGKFASGVKAILRKKLPATMPARDRVLAYTGAMCELANRPPEPLLVSAEAERGLPYDSIAECYAVWMFRQNARQEVQNKITSNLNIRGPLDWLYRSRDDYQSITDDAWQRFQNGSITVAKAYSDPRHPGRPIQHYFSLPHSAIAGLMESRLVRLEF